MEQKVVLFLMRNSLKDLTLIIGGVIVASHDMFTMVTILWIYLISSYILKLTFFSMFEQPFRISWLFIPLIKMLINFSSSVCGKLAAYKYFRLKSLFYKIIEQALFTGYVCIILIFISLISLLHTHMCVMW